MIAGWKKEMSESIDTNEIKRFQTRSAGVNALLLENLEKKNVQITTANGVHAPPF
ncbi:hypothetical protein QUF89_14915 [Peribacillus simplex]|uniref:Uncharacterized protein n=1 Tax=Peribacillus simplex TaxID=1478 RepID=A0AAW7IPB0_9BACI|nr:hypothetical protein [Peribacillus simplex]